MKCLRRLGQITALVLLLAAAAVTTAQAQNNSISGMIFDASGRRTVSDVYVELMNELGITLRRIRVAASGRFQFTNLSAGNFKVKVVTLGTNYREEIQDATLVSIPRGGGSSSDVIYLEFYLKLDPRKVNTGSPGAGSVVFAQEVPDAARKLYKKGVEQLDDRKDAGLETLKQAIEIFPNYYDALDRLGDEYVRRKQYADAAPYLVRAIDVNQRSYSSFYALGVASYNLNNLPAALEAFRAATVLNPQSVNAQLWYGITLRINGNYEKAEKALLQAKSIAQKTSSPVAEIHWQLALLYEKTGRYKEAAAELERFLEIQPNVPNADKIKKLIAQLKAKVK